MASRDKKKKEGVVEYVLLLRRGGDKEVFPGFDSMESAGDLKRAMLVE